MILAVDVGNSTTVLGAVEDGRILKTVRLATNVRESAAEHAVRLDGLLRFSGFTRAEISGGILCSAVPSLTPVVREALEMLIDGRVMTVGPGLKTGLNIGIDDPGTLAPDLLAGAGAAMRYYPLPAIVIDFGTAVSVCAVDEGPRYLGGAILPGLRLSYEALTRGTSLLPDIQFAAPKTVIGKNTVSAMQSGAVYGTAAMVDGLTARMEREIGKPCVRIATGSAASLIAPACREEVLVDESLILRGLWTIYEKNIKIK